MLKGGRNDAIMEALPRSHGASKLHPPRTKGTVSSGYVRPHTHGVPHARLTEHKQQKGKGGADDGVAKCPSSPFPPCRPLPSPPTQRENVQGTIVLSLNMSGLLPTSAGPPCLPSSLSASLQGEEANLLHPVRG